MKGLLRSMLMAATLWGTSLCAHGATEVCIFVGAPGEAAYATRFHSWSARLAAALMDQGGLPPNAIQRVPADETATPLDGETMRKVLSELATRLKPTDRLLVLFIGHGSDQNEPKLVLAGPDMTANTFRTLLDAIPARPQLVINTASASGGFIEALRGPERVVCTSTQSGVEQNATEFAEHVITTLETGQGDGDHNGRLSWAEWLGSAAARTAAWYGDQGFIATEHAVLDDNGDGRGTRLPIATEGVSRSDDGALSALEYLNAYPVELTEHYEAYREALAAVTAWKAQKGSVDEAAYWQQLETLLLEVARRYPDKANVP